MFLILFKETNHLRNCSQYVVLLLKNPDKIEIQIYKALQFTQKKLYSFCVKLWYYKYFRMRKIMDFKPGVIYGRTSPTLQVGKWKIILHFLLNVSTETVNAAMEAAQAISNSYSILKWWWIKFAVRSSNENRSCYLRDGIGCKTFHDLAEKYGWVVLHTDHAAKKLLPWIDGF